jgi:hypothetical protein
VVIVAFDALYNQPICGLGIWGSRVKRFDAYEHSFERKASEKKDFDSMQF